VSFNTTVGGGDVLLKDIHSDPCNAIYGFY